MRCRAISFFIVLFIVAWPPSMEGISIRESQKEAKITAAMITNLSSFTDWPERNDPYFHIAVIGNKGIQQLKLDFESLSIKGKPVKFHTELKDIDLKIINTLFIGRSVKKEKYEKIMNDCKKLSILLVSSREYFLEQGGGAQIFRKDNRLHFNINKRELRNRNLNMRSQVLKLATKVIH